LSEIPVTEPDKLEKGLRALNLNENPFAVSPNFPFPYFGHRTLVWAVTTARHFIEQFYGALKMDSPLAP
jgi:hypothetical protein